MPPKIVKQTAAQKRDLKKKEAFDLAKEALTADTVAVREDENVVELEQAPAEVPPALAEINAAEIKRCIKRMKALEHKLDIAYEHSQYAVPTEIMDGLGIANSASSIKIPNLARLEDQYGRFRSNVKISISGAIEAQDCYSEILTICFGERTAVIYKLLRRDLHKEYRHLTRQEKANKTIKQDAPILAELKAVSSLVHDLVNERGSPGTWPLSFRDATRLTVDRCFHSIFVTLRGKFLQPKIMLKTRFVRNS
jgi:hypothetical protein